MNLSADDSPASTFPVRVVIRKYTPHDWDEPTPTLDLFFQPVTISLACPTNNFLLETFTLNLALAIKDAISEENPHDSPDGVYKGGDGWPMAVSLHYRVGSAMADSKWLNEDTLGERMEFLRSASKYTPGWVVLEVFFEDGEWRDKPTLSTNVGRKGGKTRSTMSIVQRKVYSGEDWSTLRAVERLAGVPWCGGRGGRTVGA